MAPSAANRFLKNEDLLYCLGKQINNRKLLLDLCLVSKYCNEVFSVFLYKELWFSETNHRWLFQENGLDSLLANERLKHVRTLSFAVYADVDLKREDLIIRRDMRESICLSAKYQTAGACLAFNEGVMKLLGKIPRLESFSWLGYPLFTTTLSTLHQECPALKELTIIYPSNLDLRLGRKVTIGRRRTIPIPQISEWEPLRQRWETPNLPPFRNLNRLHIHNMWGRQLNQWREMITVILVNSPGLSDLGLSLSNSTRHRDMDIEWHGNREALHPAYFLRELCGAYTRVGGKPLALQSLHLGHFMFLLRWGSSSGTFRPAFPEEQENGGFLDDLTNLSQLQDLSLDLAGDRGFGDNQEWWQTAPGPLPKLEKLSIRKPTTWLARWAKALVQGGTTLRQLKVYQDSERPDYTLQPSQLATSWSDLLECRPQELLLQGNLSAVIHLDHVMAAGDSIRLLAMNSDLFRNNVEYLASRMPNLEGIWVMEPYFFYAIRLGNASSIQAQKNSWGLTVQQVARVCRRLKFFRFGSVTWRIERTVTGFRLRELDRMENEGPEIPELFQISLPYTFDTAHAAKYWVNDRCRDDDEML
ncbi:hypothetical protein F4818DRAFT_435463 [Hypoxylon cercidicola]|nr:hypothetical protein F4818DRAFT_435463 [Hypoxylon cercidicola]